MPFKPLRRRFVATHGRRFFEAAMTSVFVCVLARPVAQDPPIHVRLRAQRAQEFVDQLRALLPTTSAVQIEVVTYNPLVFSVRPLDAQKDRFLLTMELGFLLMLNDDELRAALAHELGHVWIYTHRPYLQTERLANIIGQRLVDRASFEKIYSKLWVYEGASGVPMDELLALQASPQSPAEPDALGRRLPAEPHALEGSGIAVWAKKPDGSSIAGLDGALYDPYRASVIQRVQRALRDRGLYEGPMNGILDRPTMNSIYAFQEASHLQQCGVPTPRTRKMLEQGSHTDLGN